ncbi:GTPase Era, partial [candidate division KSB1 bacterium]|nr:GTPase Era [candidate division KSB1 bacterium]
MSEKKMKVGYVAIVGQPNVGKSTLLNNLLDFKVAAVTRKPQTTRHQIRGILNGEDHQIIFFDTPGLLEPKYKLQEAMRQAAFRSLKDADLVLFMVAAAEEPDAFDTKLLNEIHDFNSSIILLLNKMDIISKNQVLPVMEYFTQLGTLKSIMPISALKKEGLDSLKEEILSALPEGQPFYDKDHIMDHPERFL